MRGDQKITEIAELGSQGDQEIRETFRGLVHREITEIKEDIRILRHSHIRQG